MRRGWLGAVRRQSAIVAVVFDQGGLIFGGLRRFELSRTKKTKAKYKTNMDYDQLMLSGPAGPYCHESGINRVLYPTVSGRFTKQPFYVKSSHRCSHLGIALNLLGILEMRSLLIIVVKLYSYKESDVGNLRIIKYFRDYCRPFRNT